ncbi:MAG: hypothetical protein [Circular genetic element sp.]|jgi:hypothetical protein|nr:MAG: hypothetical protein [Circular genetic element sp.]
MARLPSRRELADRINELERDLKIVAGAAAAGYGTRALGGPGIATRIGATAAGPIARATPGLALADLIIRQEESVPFRVGEEFIEQAERLATGVEARARSEGLPIAGRPAVAPRRKKVSKFSKAVSAGMKTVKASTSYGKKGTINNAKRAFSVVTKTASKINKGGKVAKSGITRKIGLAVRKIL